MVRAGLFDLHVLIHKGGLEGPRHPYIYLGILLLFLTVPRVLMFGYLRTRFCTVHLSRWLRRNYHQKHPRNHRQNHRQNYRR